MDIRLLVALAGWLAGWWLLWRVPRVGDGAADPTAGADGATDGDAGPASRPAVASCSIIIPARNEAASLATLLDSLAAQPERAGQIIVVDDESDDGTGALARAYAGVTVLAGEPVPAGWTGKAWACEQGSRVATGSTLVFLDADVRLAPGALEALLAEQQRRGGLVSVQPYHRMRRAYERLSAVFNLVGFMGVGSASPGRDGRSRGAFGPCFVTSRDDYDAVGGHRAVRGEIVEDIALARQYAAAGLAVHTFGGAELVSFRMYPGGLGQLVEGWSKNMATGAGSISLGRLALVFLWVTTVLMSVQFVLEATFGRIDVDNWQTVAMYALFVVQVGTMLRQLGNFGWLSALLYPGLVGIFVVVFARSAYLTVVRRRVMWRGRTIPLAASRRWAEVAVTTDE